MSIIFLLVSSALSLFLLIAHSYFFRGLRITLNFFIFAFIWAFLKEGMIRRELIYEQYPYLKLYGFSEDVPIFFTSLAATIGWVFTFYISWCIAERILRRLDYFKNRIFATLLLSSLAIIAISYCIEVTAMNIGWWHWDIETLNNKDLFIGGYSFMPIGAWLFFCFSFLATFFLIECSRYRKSYWQSLFLFIPFLYGWSVYYYGPRVSILPIGTIEVTGVFMLLISSLAIFNRLPFEYGNNIDYQSRYIKNINVSSFLRNIPIFVLLLMISIVLIADFSIINRPILIISAIPLLFLLSLSVKRIPLQLIIMAALTIIISDDLQLRSLFAIMPLMLFFILWLFSKSKEKDRKTTCIY